MASKTMKHVAALAVGGIGIAGAVAIVAATPSQAAPVSSNPAAIRASASNRVTDVRYYRRYHGHSYYRRGWAQPYRYAYPYYRAYPYSGYAYPYYPYAYPYVGAPGLSFGWGW